MVERDHRVGVATFFAETAFVIGAPVAVGESAAQHAIVKRLSVGDVVGLTDGVGHTARGTIASLDRRAMQVNVTNVSSVDRPSAIHLRAPVADRDRMLWLAEKATELGIASWLAVRFRRSASVTPRGEGDAFAVKARLRMISALEQSGGAWLPAMLPDASVETLTADSTTRRLLLDADAEPLTDVLHGSRADETVIALGPEGGLEDDERDALVAAGWQCASLAATTLRFETAGIAAVAVCRALVLSERS